MKPIKKRKIIKVLGVFIALIISINLFSDGVDSENHDGEAQTPSGSSIQKGENFKDVLKEFEDNGFKNIKTKKLDDLITGWVTEDGEVESVSVDGENEYSPNEWYPNDVEVVITYHTFPEEKKSETNSNGEKNTEKTNAKNSVTEKPTTEETNTKITESEKPSTEKNNTKITDSKKPATKSIYEKAYRVRFQDYDICYLIDEDAHTVSVFDTTEEYTYIYTSAYTGDFNNGIDFDVDGLKHHAHYKYWDTDTTLIVADESGNENKAEKRDVDTIEKQIKLRP